MLTAKTRYTYADYASLPEGSPYQLIQGELIMKPAPELFHQQLLLKLANQFFTQIQDRGLGAVYIAPTDVYLDEANCVQPDISVILRGSFAKLTREKIVGAPDLVVEILSPSNAYYDLRAKKDLYAEHGVKEYWIVDPWAKSIEIFVKKKEGFELTDLRKSPESVSSQLLSQVTIHLGRLFEDVRSN